MKEVDESNKNYARARHNRYIYSRETELTLSELEVFRVIGGAGDITPMEIADQHGRTKGAISQVIEKLRVKRLIEFHENPEDLRKKQFVLTDLGRALYEEDEQRRYNLLVYLSDILNDRSEEELEEYLSITQRIRRGMHDYFAGQLEEA